MKALKSERAAEIVSMNFDNMTAKAADGTLFRFEVVLTKIPPREIALARLKAWAAPAHPGEGEKEGRDA